MATARPSARDPIAAYDADAVARALTWARRAYYEEPVAALAEAIRCDEAAGALENAALHARAQVIQGLVSLHRGDVRSAMELVLRAERHCSLTDDLTARAEVTALKAQVSFFMGSYADAIGQADLAIRLADRENDLALRIFVRRATCPVLGTVGVEDLDERLDVLLALTVASGDRWEEAISRNDIACYFGERRGDLARAQRELERARAALEHVSAPHDFALSVLHSTCADILLQAGQPAEALAEGGRALALLEAAQEPNPYVLGATVRAAVQARMELGQQAEAQRAADDALAWLGERVPQTRSLILTTLATALRAAGRPEQGFDALARAAEIERHAFRELSALQLSLERATLEIEQLRDQAERDWLTGLHNRRHLARRLERLSGERRAVVHSLAVLDLDRFKDVNDRFGHAVGDKVLVRVAYLLREALRITDTIVRSGGEEFIVLMPATDLAAATACCERIGEAIRGERWAQIALGLQVTASVGVACASSPRDLDLLTGWADRLLYDAKRAGRDRVAVRPA